MNGIKILRRDGLVIEVHRRRGLVRRVIDWLRAKMAKREFWPMLRRAQLEDFAAMVGVDATGTDAQLRAKIINKLREK